MLPSRVGHTQDLVRQADGERIERGNRNCEKDRRRVGEMFLDPNDRARGMSVCSFL